LQTTRLIENISHFAKKYSLTVTSFLSFFGKTGNSDQTSAISIKINNKQQTNLAMSQITNLKLLLIPFLNNYSFQYPNRFENRIPFLVNNSISAPCLNSNLLFRMSFAFKKSLLLFSRPKSISMLNNLNFYYETILIKFLQSISNNKISLNFSNTYSNQLTLEEKLLCSSWIQKSSHFQRTLGNGFFLREAFYILFCSLKYKDITLFAKWLNKIFHKISFWKSRFLISFLRYALTYYFQPHFDTLKIKGIRIKLKGKISVSGNARTRHLRCSIGKTSFSNYRYRIHYSLSLVRTFTGVQGLQIWLAH
jgi:hypothetical protein